nr:PREDICTED: enoyl-CoA delta isomerase 1, mitochondrial-like isoform X1 [Megachile rotundata]XP_012137726.1 PREDICTED: enoyl-CoA delta isomerase 1, mitochondrial-like isoform X1 [Megachile rotundata]XP_012137727.1 PREDICTED: enoyl-CoA delta isomerase 1, mitochondrial-like isoform X1 [Megachile rotundata]XP_012137728.1 PREDICTED: enoyl-CoA delta isomerase 1, mitochondrial-like isoform X1 [Megachile rotundata]
MFAVKRIFNKIKIPLYATYSTNSKLVEVIHENETGIATISMANPPVNSLSKELLNALNKSLMDVQQKQCSGVILTSSLPTVFSAGLDIMSMYNKNEKQLTEYWQTLQDTWLTLYGLGIPIAAAINGASPAGGCLLAMSCEYRVFVEGKHTIGLNETKLGIVAPTWFRELYIDTIGYRKAEMALLRGTLFHPKEALEIGLVDELVPDKTNAISKCQNYIRSFKNIPLKARQKAKSDLRRHNLLWLKENRELDLNEFLTLIQLPKVQAGLKLYIESLKQK